jgi:hypothetical protein
MLMTIGLEHFEDSDMSSNRSWEMHRLAQDLGGSNWINVDELSLHLWGSLQDNFGVSATVPLVILDCRGLGDPSTDFEVRGHKGMHPAILRQFEGEDTKTLLIDVMVDILLILEKSDAVNVALVCRHGRHRSVAVAVVLHWMLDKMGKIVTTKHTSEGKYWKCLCANSCKMCHWGPNSEVASELTPFFDSFDQALQTRLNETDPPVGTTNTSSSSRA